MKYLVFALLFFVSPSLLASKTDTIDSHQAPCRLAKRTLRLGLTEEQYPALPVWDSWTPVMGDNIPLSDAQLAWLAGDEILARSISEDMEARGGKVFAGLLATAIGVGTSMVGWTLFGAQKIPTQVSLPIGVSGLIVAAVAVFYTTYALQKPIEPFQTPTPRHRLTREEAYQLIQAYNKKMDAVICGGKN